jgi:hypothetical protein
MTEEVKMLWTARSKKRKDVLYHLFRQPAADTFSSQRKRNFYPTVLSAFCFLLSAFLCHVCHDIRFAQNFYASVCNSQNFMLICKINFSVMIIANPIYDIVFKRLMENKRIARFFVETIIGEKVEEIAMVPQEYTYYSKIKEKTGKKKKEEWVVLSLIRFDFVATILTDKGEHKKIFIEIQKSSKPADLLRFRTYLGEQYKRMDVVEIATGKVERALPVICIYLLGFKLPKIKSAAIKVGRTYIDMIGQREIPQKNMWIEALTHDGYFVQIPHVKGKPRTLLEKLLSIFEQQYFIDDKKTIKEYEYPVDNENVKAIMEILRHAAADAKTKREMEEAWWYEENEKEYEKVEKELLESKKIIADKDREIAELRRLLGK